MKNRYSQNQHALANWSKVKLTPFPYLTLSDVEKIFFVINDLSDKGLRQFADRARVIATKVPSGKASYRYQFENEVALFELFREVLPLQLKSKGIDCWGRLMQYIS